MGWQVAPAFIIITMCFVGMGKVLEIKQKRETGRKKKKRGKDAWDYM